MGPASIGPEGTQNAVPCPALCAVLPIRFLFVARSHVRFPIIPYERFPNFGSNGYSWFETRLYLYQPISLVRLHKHPVSWVLGSSLNLELDFPPYIHFYLSYSGSRLAARK
jgi:hypothetical protein